MYSSHIHNQIQHQQILYIQYSICSEVYFWLSVGFPHRVVHFLVGELRIVRLLFYILEVSGIELGNGFHVNYSLNFLLGSHVAHNFPHKIKFVFVDDLKIFYIQHLRYPTHKRSRPTTRSIILGKYFLCQMLDEGHSV